jgi:hypothetical protein
MDDTANGDAAATAPATVANSDSNTQPVIAEFSRVLDAVSLATEPQPKHRAVTRERLSREGILATLFTGPWTPHNERLLDGGVLDDVMFERVPFDPSMKDPPFFQRSAKRITACRFDADSELIYGVCKFDGGHHYVGGFKDGLLHGAGELTDPRDGQQTTVLKANFYRGHAHGLGVKYCGGKTVEGGNYHTGVLLNAEIPFAQRTNVTATELKRLCLPDGDDGFFDPDSDLGDREGEEEDDDDREEQQDHAAESGCRIQFDSEDATKRVDAVYVACRSSEQLPGRAADDDPIYGEITQGSFQNVLRILRKSVT